MRQLFYDVCVILLWHETVRQWAMTLTKRESNKLANRAAILNGAVDVFISLGFGAATVRDIVRASGLAIGSYYNYFDSKEDVFAALVEEIITPLATRLKASRREARTVEDFVRGPFGIAMDFALENPRPAALIARNQTLFRETFYLGRAATLVQRDLQTDLEAWVAAGKMAPHDSALMTDAMLALGFDVVVQAALSQTRHPARLDFLVDLFCSRLAPASGTASPTDNRSRPDVIDPAPGHPAGTHP